MNILGNNDSKVRVRTKNELEVRKDEFLRICFLLDKLEIKYFLQTGILLGAIRHNGFIPWDWDVELSVFSDDVVKKMDNLIFEIKQNGFIIEKFHKDLTKLKIDFIGKLPKETTSYTIQGWKHDKRNKVYWRNKFKVPDYLFAKMKKIKLFEKYHWAPYPPENYLEHQYGNWKKPMQSSDKSKYLTRKFSGISFFQLCLTRILNIIR